jgi:hypothetical protein
VEERGRGVGVLDESQPATASKGTRRSARSSVVGELGSSIASVDLQAALLRVRTGTSSGTWVLKLGLESG